MDENRVEGTVRNVGGKVQEQLGRVTGDTATQAKGKLNQAIGAGQDLLGQSRGRHARHRRFAFFSTNGCGGRSRRSSLHFDCNSCGRNRLASWPVASPALIVLRIELGLRYIRQRACGRGADERSLLLIFSTTGFFRQRGRCAAAAADRHRSQRNISSGQHINLVSRARSRA